MPTIPPENVRPAGSSAPPENIEPVREIPEQEDEVGGVPAGFQYLSDSGASMVINPAVGTTELGYEDEDQLINTLADGTEDGQQKLIFLRQNLTWSPEMGRTIRCNLYRRNNSNYAAINEGVRLFGGGAWVQLRWTTGIPTSTGSRNLWVIVGGSQILPADPPRPHTLLIGHGRGVESGDAVSVQLLPIIPEGGSGISGVRMPADGRLHHWSLRYHSTENIPGGLTLRVVVGGVNTDSVVAGSVSAGTELTYSDDSSVNVSAGDIVQVLLLGADVDTGGVLTASLATTFEDTAGGLAPYMIIVQGTVPS